MWEERESGPFPQSSLDVAAHLGPGSRCQHVGSVPLLGSPCADIAHVGPMPDELPAVPGRYSHACWSPCRQHVTQPARSCAAPIVVSPTSAGKHRLRAVAFVWSRPVFCQM